MMEQGELSIEDCCKTWRGNNNSRFVLDGKTIEMCESNSKDCKYYGGTMEVDEKRVIPYCTKVTGYEGRFKDVPSQRAQDNEENS